MKTRVIVGIGLVALLVISVSIGFILAIGLAFAQVSGGRIPVKDGFLMGQLLLG